MLAAVSLLLLAFIGLTAFAIDTGFWYGNTRPPDSQYMTVPYCNGSVLINRPFHDGPGQDLLSDPLQENFTSLYAGNTINRQSFDTQFVLDLEAAINIDRNRIFVVSVLPGNIHFSHFTEKVIVQFIILERNQTNGITLLEAVAELTNQIQNTSAPLYHGTSVTNSIEPLWGLQITTWDISLRLFYAIENIGRGEEIEGYYLNQGGMGACDKATAINFPNYCEFERFFEDDVSRALNISYYRVQILFVKSSSLDSVHVFFRILPRHPATNETNVVESIANLMMQVPNLESELYKGNVTIRVDPLWSVSNELPTLRSQAPLFTYKYYKYDPERIANDKIMTLMTPYDRCKANRRCAWGIQKLNQSTNDVRYYHQLFENGEQVKVDLFLDFEDWRLGTRGFSWEGIIPPYAPGTTSTPNARADTVDSIRGGHFFPFSQRSLGPDIPCYREERNQGLILSRQVQSAQIYKQQALVDDIKGKIDWSKTNIEWAVMGPVLRSRKDVKETMSYVIDDLVHWWTNEVQELNELNTSQCVLTLCTITFNTSSLMLTGAINDYGVIRTTPQGTEVAVFSFNSIYLGPETEVILVGQRAISLVSKTTITINNTIMAEPGTIGGFQGGYSVARLTTEALSDTPRSVIICELGLYCLPNATLNPDGSILQFTEAERADITTNNVNGPGSGNLKVHPIVIKTEAPHIPEVQVVTTSAQKGQTLAGGFLLSFGQYTTPLIPHDATGSQLKKMIEDNLNIVPPETSIAAGRNIPGAIAGVGAVDVSRSDPDSQEGYKWYITFSTVIGNAPQLIPTTYLKGLKANVTVETLVEGNEIGGTFQLHFQGNSTRPIASDESAEGLKAKLLELPMVTTAYVERIDPGNCDDGLCDNGPHPCRGLVWSVYVTTNATNDNVTPLWLTDPKIFTSGTTHRFSYTSSLSGTNASMSISLGMATSPNGLVSLLNVTIPFSLAFGGSGASYGGLGGKGYSENPVGATYNDVGVSDLLGGSGGCMRSPDLFEVNAVRGDSAGRGGHGGGAIELVAANDVTIGTYGKIIMNGGDGGQTSEGGGGGGSGGAILISAGGVIVNAGKLDVHGGSGGFGGPGIGTVVSRRDRGFLAVGSTEYERHETMAGGGGGGGRIALFAQSVTDVNSVIDTEGGPCGIYKTAMNESVAIVSAKVLVKMLLPLDDDRLNFIGSLFVWEHLPLVSFIDPTSITRNYLNGVTFAYIGLQLTMNSTVDVAAYETLLNTSAAGQNIAEIVFLETAFESFYYTYITPERALPSGCNNNGNAGTYYSQTTMTSSLLVRETVGAENTTYALFLSNNEATKTVTGSSREAPFAWNGPVIPFEPSRPNRVTYYTRMDAVEGESKKARFGSLFTLLSRGVPGLNISNVIGVSVGDKMMHGHNFGSAVDEKSFLKRFVVINEYPAFDRWYKIDIRINWNINTYAVSLDDQVVVRDVPFDAPDVDGIRLSVSRAVGVWFDEIYIGFDNTMEFTCPTITRTGTRTVSPEQRSWSLDELAGDTGDGFTQYKRMTRHYSSLEVEGAIPFDGSGQITFNSDIKLKYPTGDYPTTQGKLNAGSFVYLVNNQRTWKTPSGRSATLVNPKGLWFAAKDGPDGAGDGRQFWYTEYDYNSSVSSSLNGGVAACSSQDLNDWRFEGIVFHYTNLSDLVKGEHGPFYVERPKVLFNPTTNNYVMWAAMDTSGAENITAPRSLAMNAIMTSPFIDGPFLFRRSFYPDGNQTRDQVIFVNDENRPALARTYYQTIEFVLPGTMMQPTWESAKFQNGKINFRSNYHRANYHKGYDYYHDIYNQRWRKEDIPWKVLCIDRLTGVEREVPVPVDSNSKGCRDPEEYKVVLGQGVPIIQSKFVSPNESANSWWLPTSVPDVQAQPWASNYRDGYCGVRFLDDGMDEFDPFLDDYVPPDRAECSNIADNPVLPKLQDKLIGVQTIIARRRAKFLSVSELTPDYMDTTGVLRSFEGEFDGGNLISMIIDMGQFGFTPGVNIGSTYSPPVMSEFETAIDYKTRFRQYIRNHNDRAAYSLACVLDGICPVNFKDQLTEGQS